MDGWRRIHEPVATRRGLVGPFPDGHFLAVRVAIVVARKLKAERRHCCFWCCCWEEVKGKMVGDLVGVVILVGSLYAGEGQVPKGVCLTRPAKSDQAPLHRCIGRSKATYCYALHRGKSVIHRLSSFLTLKSEDKQVESRDERPTRHAALLQGWTCPANIPSSFTIRIP